MYLYHFSSSLVSFLILTLFLYLLLLSFVCCFHEAISIDRLLAGIGIFIQTWRFS